MKNLNYILVAFTLLLLTGCADVSHYQILDVTGHTYGFWGGTWHGMIMIPSFIGSLIWDDVAMYAINNNGAWYDFGFVGGFWMMIRFFRFVITGGKINKDK
jgi:hypothetical protein